MASVKNITKLIIGEELYYLKDKQIRDSIGVASGIATLDAQGKIPTSQIPAQSGQQSDWSQTDSDAVDYIKNKPTNVSSFTNDAGYLTSHQDISGKEDISNKVSSWSNSTNNTHYPGEKLVKDSLDNKVDKISGKGLSTNDFTTTLKDKLDGIASGAEVNQNAFSNVVVGSTTVSSNGKTGSITLVAGNNITLTPDNTNKNIEIAASQPTVNDATLTIQKNGTTVKTFTANASSNVTANITIDKSDVGLSNVTNDSQVKRSEMGVANGVATLGEDGKVPSAQLPSFVDDVLEYAQKSSFPATGESGKIYIDLSNDTTWRWSGSAYVQIKGDLVIGTTTGTAYDGGSGNTLSGKVTNIETALDGLKLKKITQSDYNALVNAGTTDANTVYIITD